MKISDPREKLTGGSVIFEEKWPPGHKFLTGGVRNFVTPIRVEKWPYMLKTDPHEKLTPHPDPNTVLPSMRIDLFLMRGIQQTVSYPVFLV